jgi:hypothetical protein
MLTILTPLRLFYPSLFRGLLFRDRRYTYITNTIVRHEKLDDRINTVYIFFCL